MPRCFSISIQSEVAWRDAFLALTEPAIWIAPEKSSSFSVSVVLPASGWEMMAKVRRRCTSGLSSVVMRSKYRQKGERRLPGRLIVKTPKQALHEVEKAPPGERFQRLYRQRQQGRHARWTNVAFNVGGLLVIGVGIAT